MLDIWHLNDHRKHDSIYEVAIAKEGSSTRVIEGRVYMILYSVEGEKRMGVYSKICGELSD